MAGPFQVTQQSGQPPGGMEVIQDDADALHVAVKEYGITISQTPTISAAAIYAAGDNVGGLLTFANAAREAGDGGILVTFTIIDDDQEDAALELWIWDRTFTAGADNAPWSPSDADLENCLGVVTTADGAYYDSANQGVATVQVTVRYDLVGTSLFGRLVTRGAPTYTATDDLTIRVGLVQD